LLPAFGGDPNLATVNAAQRRSRRVIIPLRLGQKSAVLTDAAKGIGRSRGLDAGEDGLQGLERSMPTGTLGEPRDIMYAVRSPASDEAKPITGQPLVVGGGQTLPEPMLALAPGVSPVSSRRGHRDDGCGILAPDARFGRGACAACCQGGYHERVR
jgi:hypothetical protein